MSKKIPVRIEWISGNNGEDGDIEVIMDLGDFESSRSSIRSNIKTFKKKYLSALAHAKKINMKILNNQKRQISTRERWRVCKILSDFNKQTNNKFEIINYKQAYSRDFGLPIRSIRTFLDFGQYFTEDEITNKIPYSIYAELVFRVNGLRSRGIFDSEKKRLLDMVKEGKLPNRDVYRAQLNDLITQLHKQENNDV